MANPIKRAIRILGTPLFRARGFVAPDVEYIDVKSKDLPATFDGYRLAVVSDLHLPDNLCAVEQVLDTLRAIKPNGIVLAGDLSNRHNRFDAVGVAAFLQAVGNIAPAFAISGNHEQNEEREQVFFSLLADSGVTPLRNQTVLLEHGGDTVPLCGVSNPDTAEDTPAAPAILLIHDPADAVQRAANGYFLAVCGHAHGGQVRFKTRGLFAPGQGFFAKYISGLYRIGDMQMVVSRGLGDSSLPIRLHNKPHLPVITLKTEN